MLRGWASPWPRRPSRRPPSSFCVVPGLRPGDPGARRRRRRTHRGAPGAGDLSDAAPGRRRRVDAHDAGAGVDADPRGPARRARPSRRFRSGRAEDSAAPLPRRSRRRRARSPTADLRGIRARLPGGEKIELGGIVWSETEPRALLNDRVLGIGFLRRGLPRREDRRGPRRAREGRRDDLPLGEVAGPPASGRTRRDRARPRSSGR